MLIPSMCQKLGHSAFFVGKQLCQKSFPQQISQSDRNHLQEPSFLAGPDSESLQNLET